VKAAGAPAAAAADEAPDLNPKAEAFVSDVLKDGEQPVVMFALEWCEFCWSVRKMFDKFDIPYRSVDLDSAAYQKDNWGGEIRNVLKVQTGQPTIPQIFVGGEHIGGCTETFDAFNAGKLQEMLSKSGVAFKPTGGVNAYSFLPGWLHPR